ncbi:MAG TPA: MFS transporter [Candidatus Aminicenantes bacterium]|nr:MFS transporter [Candidatus Aminicenantes bacterium]
MKRSPPSVPLLALPLFGPFVVAALVSNVGSWMQSFSEQWVVVLQAGPLAARWAGRLGFFSGLATLLVTPFGGMLVDRIGRRRMLLASQLWLAAIALAMGVLACFPGGLTLWRLVLFSLATGTGIALMAPTTHSLMADLLPADRLAAGAGLMSLQFNLGRMAGPALAALALPLVGVAGNFTLNALSFLGLVWLSLRLPPARPAARGPSSASYAEALAACRRDPELWLVMILSLAAGLFAWSYHSFVAVYAVRYLAAGPGGAAALLVFYGAGALVGSLLLTRDRGRSVWGRLLGSMLGYGLALALMGFFPHPRWTPWVICLLGLGHAFFGNLMGVEVQRRAPEAVRGRVTALYLMAVLGVTPLANLLAGEVAQTLGFAGVRQVLAVQGLLLALVAVWATGWRRLRRRSG